ncbi:hypothetical protein KEF29_31475 [Streptomyces tuirus]|uniref:Ig-like domain-containing protein n=1 Tax=Streptomyces tuirus TaxID=68278 RepID=A0A941FDR8_9ACTN|nr:hypothetical protein [Streptomyces tuirus]
MRLRTFFTAGAAALALLGVSTPSVHAAEGRPASPTLTVRGPANSAQPQGVVINCWLEQVGGDPHRRTSTGGAGVKAALQCDHPVEGMELTVQMYYYWGTFDLFWSPNGPPATVYKGAGATRLENKVVNAPCANEDMTWWFGRFSGRVTYRAPDGGLVTGELLSKDSTDAEFKCGPMV